MVQEDSKIGESADLVLLAYPTKWHTNEGQVYQCGCGSLWWFYDLQGVAGDGEVGEDQKWESTGYTESWWAQVTSRFLPVPPAFHEEFSAEEAREDLCLRPQIKRPTDEGPKGWSVNM